MTIPTDKLVTAVVFVGVGLLVFWLVPLTTTDPAQAAIGYGGIRLSLGDGRYLTPLGIALVVAPTLWVVLASPFLAGMVVSLYVRRSSPGVRIVVFGLFGGVCGVAAAVLRLLLVQ